jgi:hypothetical protein
MARGNNPVVGGASFYGLGWNVEFGRHGPSFGHAGAFSVGAQTLATAYPQAKLGIVVLANAFPSGVLEGLADSFADLVFDGKIERDWVKAWGEVYEGLLGSAQAAAKGVYAKPPAQATPALPAAAYLGRYTNDYAGDATVIEMSGGLVLKLGPDGSQTYPMRHFDRDTFLIFSTPETPEWPSSLRFAIGPDGKASSVTIETLDANGLGTLRWRPD